MADLEARFRVRIEGREGFESFLARLQQASQQVGTSAAQTTAATSGLSTSVTSFTKNIALASSGTVNLAESMTQLSLRAQQSQSSIQRWSQTLSSTGAVLSRFGGIAERSLSTLSGGTLTQGIAAQAKGLLDFRERLAGVAAVVDLPETALAGLRKEILNVAVASHQMGDDVAEALDVFAARTGEIDTARKNLGLYGQVALATGAKMADIANIGADLKQKFDLTDQTEAFGVFAKQADVGAMKLSDLAKNFPKLLASFQGANLNGITGLREGGALVQTFRRGTGTAAQAVTATEGALRDIQKHQDVIEGAGIKVEGRDEVQVLKDIIRKVHGSPRELRHVFGTQAFRGVQVLANEYRKTGRFDTLDSFTNVGVDPALLARQAALRGNEGNSLMRQQAAERQRTANQYLGDTAEWAAKHASGLSLGAMGLAGAGSALSLAGRGMRLLGGGAAAGAVGGVGNTLANVAAIPVRVVNFSEAGTGIGGGAPLAAEGAAGAGAAGTLGTGVGALAAGGVAGVATIAAAAAASLGIGWGIGRGIDHFTGLSDRLAGTQEGSVAAAENRADNEKYARKRGIVTSKQQAAESYTPPPAAQQGVPPMLANGNALWNHQQGVDVRIGIDKDGVPFVKEQKSTRGPHALHRRGVEAHR